MDREEDISLAPKARPQYHYFYGSTTPTGDQGSEDAATFGTAEQESLIGEELVSTDHEGEEHTPHNSNYDLQHLIITNGSASSGYKSSNGSRSGGVGGVGVPFTNGLGRIIVIIGLAIGMGALLIILFPHTSEPVTPSLDIEIPFPSVDRGDYGDPVEGFIDMNLFHPSLLSTTEPRTFVFPFPTGAFWTNLIVPPPTDDLSYPVAVYPYAYKWSSSELQISYPSSHRVIKKASIIDTFAPDLSFTSKEDIGQRYVTRFDPLSVTLRYTTSSKGSKWESVLVQGSPYITLKYLSTTPIIRALSIFKAIQCPGDDAENFSDLIDNSGGRRKLFGVCSIDDGSTGETIIRGVQFILKTPEGMSWIMFASEPITLSFDTIRRTTVSATEPFTGVIRLAFIPTELDTQGNETLQVSSSTGLRRLIYHAGIYPDGGAVTWDFQKQLGSGSGKKGGGEVGTVHFNFDAKLMTGNAAAGKNVGLLMFILPHHVPLLSKGLLLKKRKFDLQYYCIKGPLTPVVGNSWSYDEPLPEIGFDGPLHGWDPSVRSQILDQVADDIDRVLPTSAENIYGFGKQIARVAQLTHIVHQLGQSSNTTTSQSSNTTSQGAGCGDDTSALLEKTQGILSFYLEMLLSGSVSDALLYDSNLGGIVSTEGLTDKGEDFGNGRYNDHHFHYGYILYASAVMAKVNSTFLDIYGSHVDTLFYDVAHRSTSGDSTTLSNSSIFFPLARHKSWYDGHSYATGMFPFGNGKSQESSSEAVNCYYGAYLWSLVRQETSSSELIDFTRLLLAMEVRGAKTYWHMMPPVNNSTQSTSSGGIEVYSAKFSANYMVGNVGMFDVVCNTWFGNDPLYVHMINALPITAATALLFDNSYVSKEYPYLMNSRSSVEMAWRGYVIAIHAIIDSAEAWKEAQGLVSYEIDSASSKSQILYWISSRPGFNSTGTASKTEGACKTITPTAPSGHSNGKGSGGEAVSSSSDGTCESNPNCTALGLSGSCCPTGDGKMLGCCS